MEIDSTMYQDGALGGCNNPVIIAYNEVKQLHPSHEPRVIISIGTGSKPPKDRPHRTANDIFLAARMLLDTVRMYKEGLLRSDGIHEKFQTDHEFEQNVERDKNSSKALYFRFNVPFDSEFPIKGVKLGDWIGPRGAVTRDAISKPTRAYMEQDHVTDELRRCAELLVSIRKDRQETAKWEAFASQNLYYCCPDANGNTTCRNLKFDTRLELRQHAIEQHNFVWRIGCCHHTQSEQGAQVRKNIHFICFWDHCEENATAFDQEAEFLRHIREKHNIQNPRLVEHSEFEQWLDNGRQWLKPSDVATMSIHRTHTTRNWSWETGPAGM